jgi:tyrosine-protein phosphatase SIW14
VRRFNTILSRSYIAALLAVFFLINGAATQAGNLPGIDNFGKINENFYRGAQPEGSDYADLATFGIRTVINLTSHDAEENEKSMVEKAGMNYIQIPMTTHEYPSETKVKKFLDIVKDPANQPIYVHCVGGKHRTGVLTAVYRMTQDGWTADRAYQEMKDYKFGSSFFHPEFKSFVFDYHEDLMRERAKPVTSPVATAGAQ